MADGGDPGPELPAERRDGMFSKSDPGERERLIREEERLRREIDRLNLSPT